MLKGSSPERTAEGSWKFTKCPRCGAYSYSEELFGKKKQFFCRSCTPLRTNGKISLWKDPYDDDRRFYAKKEAVFSPGLTTLVGCNGAGKTTLITNISEELKKRGTPYLVFDNLSGEGGQQSTSLGTFLWEGRNDDTGEVLGRAYSAFTSSEGEKILYAIGKFTGAIKDTIRRSEGYGEAWFLFDAVDSGLSADYIEDIKEHVFRSLLRSYSEKMQIYIIASSNSYEMSEGTMCFSMEKMRYIGIRNYQAFVNAVRSSRRFKEERDKVFDIKDEIASRPYTFFYDDEAADRFNNWHFEGAFDADVAVMELSGFRMVLRVKKKKNGSSSMKYFMYKAAGDDWKMIPCKEEMSFHFNVNKKEAEKEMREYLCRKVFLEENR